MRDAVRRATAVIVIGRRKSWFGQGHRADV
jgi:hypothetical protein